MMTGGEEEGHRVGSRWNILWLSLSPTPSRTSATRTDANEGGNQRNGDLPKPGVRRRPLPPKAVLSREGIC